jgi:hypothetical protein
MNKSVNSQPGLKNTDTLCHMQHKQKLTGTAIRTINRTYSVLAAGFGAGATRIRNESALGSLVLDAAWPVPVSMK